MSESKRRRKNREGLSSEHPVKKKRRKWPYVVLIALALFVFLAPMIVASTGLKQRMVDWVFSDFEGNVSVSQASFNWFSPVQFKGVSVGDPNDQSVFLCEEISTSHSLLSLLFSKDYGEIKIAQPIVYAHFRDGSSNVEDAIAGMFAGDEKSTDESSLPQMKLNIVDGRIFVSAKSLPAQQLIDEISGSVQIGHTGAPVNVAMQCRFANDDNVGAMKVEALIDEGSPEWINQNFAFNINAENAPMSLVGPVMERFVGDCTTTGFLQGEFKVVANAEGNVLVTTGGATVHSAGIVAPKLFSEDQLFARTISLSGMINLSPGQLDADQLKIVSELGTVNANGQFAFAEISNLIGGGRLLNKPFQLDGHIDLASVALVMGSTLQLHDDLKVESGRIEFQANNRDENGSDRMVVNLDVANLHANRLGKPIVWQDPLRLVGTLNQTAGQLTIENAECTSEFLTMTGSGSLNNGTFRVDGDLGRLMNRLGQFVKLDDIQLAGTLEGDFGWKLEQPADANQNPLINIAGKFTVDQPQVKWPEIPAWQPEQVYVQLRATGITESDRLAIAQGGFQVQVGSEKLVSVLRSPIENFWTTQKWQLDCQASGRLAGWLGHISNFADLGTFESDGQLEVKCIADVSSQQIRLSQINYSAERFTYDGYGLAIRENVVAGNGNLIQDLRTGWTLIDDLSADCESFIANSRNMKVLFADRMQIDGNVVFQAQVGRIVDWYGMSPAEDSVKFAGISKGQVKITSDENGIYGDLSSNVNDMVAWQKTKLERTGSPIQFAGNRTGVTELLREPEIKIHSRLKLAHDFDSFSFEDLTIRGNSLAMAASGTVSDLGGSWYTQASGKWNPNWHVFNSLIQATTGQNIRLSGKSDQPFSIQGPLFATSEPTVNSAPWVLPQMFADAGLKLDQAEIMSIPIGATNINVSLKDGIATLKAADMAFAENFNRLTPQVDLRGASPVLSLGRGSIFNEVTLTPETCDQWLMYVAPLAAKATQAQGTFSIDSGGARIPFDNPMGLSARGTVRLKDVTVSAGTLTKQLIATADQLKAILKKQTLDLTPREMAPWIQMGEQQVPYAIEQGRVYHEKLMFRHKDIQFQTRGSVGFDQTINLIAEFPIQDEWIADDRWLAGLRGQSISVPVTGTVLKPVIDRDGLRQLSAQLIRSSAQSAINEKVGGKVDELRDKVNGTLENELKKGLDRLFKKDN